MGINDAGQIVGYYQVLGVAHGFLYKNGAYITIDNPNGYDTYLTGINSAGAIAGYYFTFDTGFHSFVDVGAPLPRYRAALFPRGFPAATSRPWESVMPARSSGRTISFP